MKTLALSLSLLFVSVQTSVPALPQNGEGEVAVIKFGWHKERMSHRPSLAPTASLDTLRQQGTQERALAQARAEGDAAKAAREQTKMQRQENATAKATNTEPPRDGYRYKTTIRNNGTKTIKSVDWDYLFIDPTTQAVVAHHQFTSDETIKPGKTKEMSVLYTSEPVKVVNARMLSKKERQAFIEQVKIAEVRFSDGSVLRPQ